MQRGERCFSINTRAFMRRKYTYKRHHVGMFGVDLVPKLTPCPFHIIGKTSISLPKMKITYSVSCMMERLNNSYYKLTSLFHQDGKGSVSWSLNSYKCKQMINISVVIMRASSHETSREIDEFRIHSKYHKIAQNKCIQRRRGNW